VRVERRCARLERRKPAARSQAFLRGLRVRGPDRAW
jgi:hypothetical protein